MNIFGKIFSISIVITITLLYIYVKHDVLTREPEIICTEISLGDDTVGFDVYDNYQIHFKTVEFITRDSNELKVDKNLIVTIDGKPLSQIQ
jgi:hypothetical protein